MDERSERACQVDSHKPRCRAAKAVSAIRSLPAHLAQLPIRSDALSDARRLAWLARSTPRSSRLLARVDRAGLTSVDAG